MELLSSSKFTSSNKTNTIWLWLFLLLPILSNAQVVEIWEIQGDESFSPMLDDLVTTENNIVTAIGADFFVMQTPDNRSDGDNNTSDGIFVFTGSSPGLIIGDHVDVTGTVIEFDGMTELSFPGLSWELISDDGSVVSPLELDENFPGTAGQPISDLERIECMLVSCTALVCGPSGGSDRAEIVATSQRPFREPGIAFPGMGGLPLWDGNPEVFTLNPDGLNAPNNRFLGFGMTVEVPTGIIIERNPRYELWPHSYSLEGESLVRAVRSKNAGEVTIGSINVLLLGLEGDTNERLQKMALYITELLQSPDIIAIQEIASLDVLQDLSFFISQQPDGPDYTPYFLQANGDLNTAFLVRSSFPPATVSQLGKNELLSIGGIKHDRPPLLLEIDLPTTPATQLRVLNLHIRSLRGITGNDANFVRTKRHEQAISIANMVENLRDENLILIGDFNAFSFSDGFVDVIAQISGLPSLGAQFNPQSIVSPPLQLLTTEALAEEEEYSFVFEGNAQIIDHCMSNDLENLELVELQFARGNADAAEAFADNEFLATRSSDHDGFVVYFETEFPLNQQNLLAEEEAQLNFANPSSADQLIYLETTINQLQIELYNSQGQNLAVFPNIQDGDSIQVPRTLSPGWYLLRLSADGKSRTERILIQ